MQAKSEQTSTSKRAVSTASDMATHDNHGLEQPGVPLPGPAGSSPTLKLGSSWRVSPIVIAEENVQTFRFKLVPVPTENF